MVTMSAVVYEKDGQTYVWAFREGEEQKALDAICQTANNTETNFDWDDANVIWQRMGEAPDRVDAREFGNLFSRDSRR